MASKKRTVKSVTRREGNNPTVWAWILIFLGAVFLMQNLTGIDIGKIWPVLLIIIGVYILRKE